MSANLLPTSLGDRARSTAAVAAGIGLFLILGMWAYQGVGTEVYQDLPEVMRELMGIPVGADAAAMAYSLIFEAVGALTIAGLAVSMGASTFAGEERDGTLGLLLGNPVSRRDVLTSKVASMVLLVIGAGLVLWGFGAGAADPGRRDGGRGRGSGAAPDRERAVLGMLAAAVGAWTGRRSMAVSPRRG